MFLYAAMNAASMISGYLSVEVGERMRRAPQSLLFILSALVLVILLGIREGVGTDYSSIYVDGIDRLAMYGESRFEIGFTLLVRSCLFFSSDYHLVFFVAAAFSVGLTYLAIYRFSDNVALSIFILLFGGFFIYATNAVRQMIALALLFNAIGALRDRNWKIYAVWVGLAACFHVSALFFIVLYPLARIRISYSMAIMSLIAIWIAGGLFILFAEPLVRMISPHLASYFSSRSQYFRFGDYDVADLALCSLGLLLFMVCKVSIKEKDDTLGRAYFWIIYCGIAIGLLSGQLFILSRLAIFFTDFAIFYIPFCLSQCKSARDRGLLTVGYIVFLILSFVYLYIIRGINDAFPYESFLF